MNFNNLWNTNNWSCSSCSKTNKSLFFCGCGEKFRCPKCKYVDKVNYSGSLKNKVKCSSCREEINLIFDRPPTKWDFEEKDNNKIINVEFKIENRKIQLSIDVSNFNIETYNGNLPKITYHNENRLCNRELHYIYVLLFGFYPNLPNKCRSSCWTCYGIKVERHSKLTNIFSQNELNNTIHKEILNIFNNNFILYHYRYFVNSALLRLLLEENKPVIQTVSVNILEKIKEKSLNFSCIEGDKDNCCSICMEDYTDDCKVYRLDCCKKIIHTDCIEKWFSKYNHTCPLCRHKYDTNEEGENNSLLMAHQPTSSIRQI